MKLHSSLPMIPFLLYLHVVSCNPFMLRKPADLIRPSLTRHKNPTNTTTTLSLSLLSRSPTDDLCLSPSFSPTVENWWASGVTEWLKEYTLENHCKPRYKELGLVGHLAETYLKRTDFKCGIDTAHRCMVECSEVVGRIEDSEVARIVWFVVRSAGHVAEVGKVVHDTLVAAQINMSELIPIISRTFFWTEGFDDHTWAIIFTYMINTLSTLFTTFFPMMRGLMHINQSIQAAATAATTALTEATAAYDAAQQAMETYANQLGADIELYQKAVEKAAEKKEKMARKSRIMDNTVKAAKLGVTDLIMGQIGQGVGRAFGRANGELNHHAKHPGSESSKEGNELGLEAFIRSSCMRARESLRKGIETLFDGSMLEADGSSMFSNFTMGGNFLPDINGDAARWRDSGIEKKITRGLMLKTLNAALNSQQVYITCSQDYRHTSKNYEPSVEKKAPAATCKRDNSGPQEFKACINGFACYLYKWNSRGWAPSWRNEKIFGSDVIDEEPWNVNVTDIINSSVNAYFHNVRGGGADASALSRGIFNSMDGHHDVDSLWNAATPGIFTIPVCFSKYNWATIIDGYRFPQNGIFDTQPRNSIKNMPCNCGPWGRDTENVWKEIGLWNADVGKDRKYFEDYTTSKCGYQIYDKIVDPVERYVAFCRVHIHGRAGDRIRYAGKDWQCNIVIDVLERLGYPSVAEMSPEIYHAIYCKVARHPHSNECKGYRDDALGVILNRMGINIPGLGVGGELKMKTVLAKPTNI